jgi:hypothetical protein
MINIEEELAKITKPMSSSDTSRDALLKLIALELDEIRLELIKLNAKKTYNKKV